MPYLDLKVKNRKRIRYPERFETLSGVLDDVVVEDDDDNECEKDDDNDYDVRRGELDRWDRGARSWLSSGTMFLLIVLFHVVQVRNDLRQFTATANIQMTEACSLLEDKTVSLKSALSFAVEDIGPISFKFVRDLKTKLRAAFHFAGQIFGGRVREALVSLFKKYYCLLVGVLVTFNSLLQSATEAIKALLSHKDTFIHDILDILQRVVAEITNFVAKPEEAFGSLFASIMGEVFDTALTMIPLPAVQTDLFNDACGVVEQIDFAEIDRLLKGYMAKIIAAIAVILILYNALQYAKTVGEAKANDGNDDNFLDDVLDDKLIKQLLDKDHPESDNRQGGSLLMNCVRWLIGFFSYPPFWVFLGMGVFGWVHIKFSRALQIKADQLKSTIIDPAIDSLKESFTAKLSEYLVVLEESWSRAFTDLIRPITDFITRLSDLFKPILEMVVTWGKEVLHWIGKAFEMIEKVLRSNALAVGISAVLDCFIIKNFRSWVLIADIIKTRLFGVKWSELRGGIVALLYNSITAIFAKLNITKHFKRLFSLHFAIYLKLVTKRSIFLYVYLIVCAILVMQGFLMFIIKFLLGYF